jgi:hypothetical protein
MDQNIERNKTFKRNKSKNGRYEVVKEREDVDMMISIPNLLNSMRNNQRQTIERLERLEATMNGLEKRLNSIEQENVQRRAKALEAQQTRRSRSWFAKSWGEKLDDAGMC